MTSSFAHPLGDIHRTVSWVMCWDVRMYERDMMTIACADDELRITMWNELLMCEIWCGSCYEIELNSDDDWWDEQWMKLVEHILSGNLVGNDVKQWEVMGCSLLMCRMMACDDIWCVCTVLLVEWRGNERIQSDWLLVTKIRFTYSCQSALLCSRWMDFNVWLTGSIIG